MTVRIKAIIIPQQLKMRLNLSALDALVFELALKL